ncbi:MAG: hypothetical protein ACRCT2_09610, partial [Plesiomonas shigelloides]
ELINYHEILIHIFAYKANNAGVCASTIISDMKETASLSRATLRVDVSASFLLSSVGTPCRG